MLETRKLQNPEVVDAIRSAKQRLGDRMVVLAHHYQRPEIVALGDFRGDSFELSRIASEQTAEHIVFCGVHFMAESARILAKPHQRVYHPNLNAGCPMADMADASDVERVFAELSEVLGDASGVVPMTYMNSNAAVKALCGRNGGTVCTSSNAEKAFRWAFDHGERIFFIPDEHLGRNTANSLGLDRDRVVLWDWSQPWGGLDRDTIRRAQVYLWKGYCHVHTWYTPAHIAEARERYPGCSVVVHPECREEVVALADGVGSTSFLVRYVQDAPPGATIVIGTEINLTARLAAEHPDKNVVELSRSLCPNMFRINLRKLEETIAHLDGPEVLGEILIPDELIRDARLALDRMLQIH
ncbi:MAG: quinolinate synthase A [Myxococcales bacterium]